jgi:hypothetical protein
MPGSTVEKRIVGTLLSKYKIFKILAIYTSERTICISNRTIIKYNEEGMRL